ncbi:MAG: Lrp/AsnC family transcriptional regulator [Candidatus Micrarchaeota archaeon]
MTNGLDEIDKKILSELLQNARIPAKKLARKINCHPNTMLQRLKKLEKKGLIKKYTSQIDFSKADFDLHVIIMMKVRKGRAGDMEQLKDLLKIKEIEALHATTGVWDLMGTCRVRNRQHLLEVIQKIGSSELITKTASHMILFTYKDPHDFNPF